tara:strand:+ start:437 stop:1123 length:687 start_codon:yes stop_codon:yes gene_type:complete
MNKKILEIKKVKKIFHHNDRKIELFKDVNISLKSGELIALTGPSGSGKTSLLHIIALLDQQTNGEIFFMGKNVSQLNDLQKDTIRGKNISIIFQNNNLLSDFTALENVSLPLIIRGENQITARNKAEELLKKINLKKRIHHFPNELSGGEQQRVAIARAIISETNLILADEPTGNLDYKTSQEVFSFFLKLKKMKKTVVFATHNRELANKADYKLRISDGDIKRVNGS